MRPVDDAPAYTGAEPCMKADPDLFFALPGQRDVIAEAKRLCRTCPVMGQCLRWAMAHPELAQDGVWAATTEDERRQMRQTRAPARVAVGV